MGTLAQTPSPALLQRKDQRKDRRRASIGIFTYLQLLDFLTTVVALKFGLIETSPFIRMLMRGNTAIGLAESKMLAMLLAGGCLLLQRRMIIHWVNRWYAALVVWNLCLIVMARAGC
jgi:hypothetical protein